MVSPRSADYDRVIVDVFVEHHATTSSGASRFILSNSSVEPDERDSLRGDYELINKE
jgi:hypothetical protein